MARPRCDPFDAPAIRAAINRGETTERGAYLAYATTAGRPYARSTFALMLRNAANSAVIERPQDELDSDTFWSVRLEAKPSIVTTCADNATLRVKGGALIVYDGAHSLTYTAGGKHPSAVVMAGWGGYDMAVVSPYRSRGISRQDALSALAAQGRCARSRIAVLEAAAADRRANSVDVADASTEYSNSP
jgi:hypothetical protein